MHERPVTKEHKILVMVSLL